MVWHLWILESTEALWYGELWGLAFGLWFMGWLWSKRLWASTHGNAHSENDISLTIRGHGIHSNY